MPQPSQILKINYLKACCSPAGSGFWAEADIVIANIIRLFVQICYAGRPLGTKSMIGDFFAWTSSVLSYGGIAKWIHFCGLLDRIREERYSKSSLSCPLSHTLSPGNLLIRVFVFHISCSYLIFTPDGTLNEWIKNKGIAGTQYSEIKSEFVEEKLSVSMLGAQTLLVWKLTQRVS